MQEYSEDYLLDKRVRIFQPLNGYRASTDAVILSSLIARIKDGDAVLDVGSGTGAVALCLAERFKTLRPGITGLELQTELAELSNMSAAANGFDSWIMFNVYPQRATDPNDMDKTPDRALCDENLRWLQAVLAQTEPTMWAAWGTLIEKRDYLPGLMREMVALTREREIPWVTFGKRSKKGHPHHPLYLRKDSTPEPFDVENYLDTCF